MFRLFKTQKKLLSRMKPSKASFFATCKLLSGKGLHRVNDVPRFLEIGEKNQAFIPHYESQIFPKVRLFEESRVEKLSDFRKRIFMGIPGGIVIIVAVLTALIWSQKFLNNDSTLEKFINFGVQNSIFVFFGLVTGVAYWVAKPIMEYQTDIKTQIFPQVFDYYERIGVGKFDYKVESPLAMNELEESDIIPSYDHAHLEDYVKGSYKGVSIELVEARLTENRGNGKNNKIVYTFGGMLVRLSMNKSFIGHTIMKRDQGKVGNWFANKFSDKDKQKVALEDPVFEKEFEVYSTDQVEARYLLSTSFMERLLSLSSVMNCKGIQASFYDNHLLVMVPTKHDHFEVGSIYTPATFEGEICAILNEMEQFFGIIDTLKLNEQTRL